MCSRKIDQSHSRHVDPNPSSYERLFTEGVSSYRLQATGYRLPPSAYRLIYNSRVIALAQTAMTVATWLFIVGILGSLIVVVISFVEDLTQLFSKD